MSFGRCHEKLASIARDFCLEALALGDVSDLVTQVLERSGRLRQRRSPLQPRLVFWLVIGMAFWRHDSIPAVLGRLLAGLRSRIGDLGLWPVTESALAHARRRLGVRPLRCFFRELGTRVVPPASFRGLRVWAIDGTMVTAPDSPANLIAFGRIKASRGQSAFCHLGLTCLVDAARHLVRDAVLRKWDGSEVAGAHRLTRHLGEGDLVTLDRAFHGLPLYRAIRERGAHFLCRVSSIPKLKAIRGTRCGHQYDSLIRCRVAWAPGEEPAHRRGRPGQTKEVTMRVRVIDYCLPRHGRVRLVTSLLDRDAYPVEELAVLYHRRWEAELAFDELKVHQNSAACGQLHTTFRSKTPRGVFQEVYALLAAYNLARSAMAEAAARADLDPRRLSFLNSLRVVRLMVPQMQAAETRWLPALRRRLLDDITDTRLDRFRRGRVYPRAVRVKMSKFKLKRAHHRELRVDYEAAVRKAVA